MLSAKSGYTLVEIIVAVGLFAFIMMLSSGAYLVMIGINRQVQGIATGINNLSFALETMTRKIRTGIEYGCPSAGIDCPNGNSGFSVRNLDGTTTRYALSGGAITKDNGVALTDPSVNVTSLMFYASGTRIPPADYKQARVTIIVSGKVFYGPEKFEDFTIQTGATMRVIDI